jgi:hypothetical protein
MRLVQENVPPGQELRYDLLQQDSMRQRRIGWHEFVQPDWVEVPTTLDLTALTGIMFTNNSPEASTAHLVIQTIRFENWENPHAVKGVIKRMGTALTKPLH